MITKAMLLVIIVAFAVFWAIAYGGRLPRPFNARTCQGKNWKAAFPDVSKKEIRAFLSIFVSAFAFSEKEQLKFNPEDSVLSIYKALYPHRWMPDALEVETLSKDLKRHYGVSLEELWSEQLTLGELFSKTRSHSPCTTFVATQP